MADIPPKANEPQTPGASNGAAGGDAQSPNDQMRQRAESAERQRDEYLSLWRQAQADYENAHQRNRRDRELEQKYRGEKLASDFLSAIDNLERALAAAREAGEKCP